MTVKAIEAIIFDLGGVIINIDYDRTIEKFSTLSRLNFAETYTQHRQNALFDQFETGRISADVFRQGLRQLLQVDFSDHDFDDAWNAMLLDIPSSRIDRLEALGRQNRIFLLSNTNEIHKQAFDQIVQESFGSRITNLAQLFEKVYYSHLVGDRKPNASIFERVLSDNHLNPETTLFIDDTLGHIEGAKRVGLQTLHLTNGQTIETLDLF
ncbi:MAG: HAD family phosphatase [Cyanobacteria bacterium P01_E01_bin.6]